MFRIDAPSAEDFAAFHEDGYVAFPAVLTDEGLRSFTDEILSREQFVDCFEKTDEERRKLNVPYRLRVKPWNNKGPWSDQLFDAPFVTAILRATIGEAFHFCHSSVHVSLRGAAPIGFHQDHHHWRHSNPVNLAERDKWYIQMLYYPNGFKRGDTSPSIIPGSHLISPTEDVTPKKLLAGEYDDRAGRELKAKHLELPPGSMVCLNARTFHAVTAKPLDSPQEFRLFVNYTFKEFGPPHRHTQAIPPEWIECASPERKKLFQREPYSPECWSRSMD